MRDLIHMLLLMVAGGMDALYATAYGNVFCGLVVCIAAGWAMAQYDHNYKRVRGLE